MSSHMTDRETLGHPLLADRDCQAQQRRALRLPQGHPRAHDKRPSRQRHRPSPAMELETPHPQNQPRVMNGRLRSLFLIRVSAVRSGQARDNLISQISSSSSLLKSPWKIVAQPGQKYSLKTILSSINKSGLTGNSPTSSTLVTLFAQPFL